MKTLYCRLPSIQMKFMQNVSRESSNSINTYNLCESNQDYNSVPYLTPETLKVLATKYNIIHYASKSFETVHLVQSLDEVDVNINVEGNPLGKSS